MDYRPLPYEFFARSTVQAARELLGKLLVRRLGREMLVGRIVEDEAYGGSDDPASHAYRGWTKRNWVMFARPGLAYIYFSYGNHFCLNVKTEAPGVPGAVLIRALEPVAGIPRMRQLRLIAELRDLANGPGKLTRALSITDRFNGHDLTSDGPLFISQAPEPGSTEIVATARIGIRVGLDKPWRFYIHGSPFISRKGGSPRRSLSGAEAQPEPRSSEAQARRA